MADDGVGRAVGEGDNGGGGIGAAVLRESRAAQDKQIGQIPAPSPQIDHRGRGRLARYGAALHVRRLVAPRIVVLERSRRRSDVLGAHGASEIGGSGTRELEHLTFVFAPIESEADERIPNRSL
jgi:hypothetical protein